MIKLIFHVSDVITQINIRWLTSKLLKNLIDAIVLRLKRIIFKKIIFKRSILNKFLQKLTPKFDEFRETS